VTGERRERVHYPSRLKKEALLKRLDEIELPPTPLDHIIDELGGPGVWNACCWLGPGQASNRRPMPRFKTLLRLCRRS
jgi:hypothetical protein